MNRKLILFYNLMFLFNLYFIIAFAFSVIYIILHYTGLGFIVDHYSSVPQQESFINVLTRSLYFSYITMFAVGYGDMTPFGLSKSVSILQAFAGHSIPYVIMLKYIIYMPSKFLNKK